MLGPMAPSPDPSQGGSIGVSASSHKARQAELAQETVRWPGRSARPGGGDADPDPTLAWSRAAHRGGLLPLRRLTAIRDGPSWRRDTLADPTTTERIRSADGALSLRALRRRAWGATS